MNTIEKNTLETKGVIEMLTTFNPDETRTISELEEETSVSASTFRTEISDLVHKGLLKKDAELDENDNAVAVYQLTDGGEDLSQVLGRVTEHIGPDTLRETCMVEILLLLSNVEQSQSIEELESELPITDATIQKRLSTLYELGIIRADSQVVSDSPKTLPTDAVVLYGLSETGNEVTEKISAVLNTD